MYPPGGGVTVKGVTERPPDLLENVFKVFEALRYTGLGQVDFILDTRDGVFKFLEINPRCWGSIGLAELAGVDLYTPYLELSKGNIPEPSLHFHEGVWHHHFSRELRLILKKPSRALGFVLDCVDPRVKSDFDWKDLRPHLPLGFSWQ